MRRSLLTALGLIGVGTLVSAYYAHPEVTPIHFDAKDPFLFPCTVSNDQLVLGFHNVVIATLENRPDVESAKSAMIGGIQLRVKHPPIPYLAAGDRRKADLLPFNILGLPPHLPEHASLQITLLYEIHVVPFYPWRHQRFFRFEMMKDSNGIPYWVGQEARG